MLPTSDFFGTPITRLLYGDNPFGGFSYVPTWHTREEMLDYYTADHCVEALFAAEEAGINAYMALGEPFILRVLRQYRNEGGKMHLLFQTDAACALPINLDRMLPLAPLGIYHQGGTADDYVERGAIDLLKNRLSSIRASGVRVGLGTHVPETLLRAEAEDWGCDFYMACLYNARKTLRVEEQPYIQGSEGQLLFYPNDRFLMMQAIRSVKKPVIAFKLFAGGQRLQAVAEDARPKEIERAFEETYSGIKQTDFCLIGTLQKQQNEIAQDASIAAKVLDALAHDRRLHP